ncbi:MAG TPA: EamA family transporter, partial [Chloroflexi bacterium]|nr:EamA family transporter [Chloroflexota bacterium]
MITSQQLHAHDQVNTTLLVAGLVLLDSMHFVFARLLLPRIAPGASVTYVLAVSTLEVGVFGLVQRRLHWQTARRHLWLFVAIGLLIALSTAGNYEAVAFIDPGTASLLSQSSVLFNIAFGVLWMGDRLSTKQIWGALLAIIGVFVISYQPGEYLRLGALVIILSSLMYALHAALAKQYAGKIDFVDFFFFRLLFTTLTLVLLATVRGVFTVPD